MNDFDEGELDFGKVDEEEVFLASAEGKKLSPKERRQLRNRISARQFRVRRKEYISELEGLVKNLNQQVASLKKTVGELRNDKVELQRELDAARATQSPLGHSLSNDSSSALSYNMSSGGGGASGFENSFGDGANANITIASPDDGSTSASMIDYTSEPADYAADYAKAHSSTNFLLTGLDVSLMQQQAAIMDSTLHSVMFARSPDTMSDASSEDLVSQLTTVSSGASSSAASLSPASTTDQGFTLSPNIVNLLPQYHGSLTDEWPLDYGFTPDNPGTIRMPDTQIFNSFIPDLEKLSEEEPGAPARDNSDKSGDADSDKGPKDELRLKLALEAAEETFKRLDAQLANLSL